MKFRSVSLIFILLAANFSPANAATVTEKIVYNKKTVLTYTVVDTLTLDPNGCKDVYIKYSIDKSYFFPNAYVMFGLYAKDKNEAQSVYVQPGNGKGTQGKDAWVGEKEMIFCGKAKSFVNEYGDKVVAPAFTKGNYTFLARFVVIKPKMVTTTSREITFKVK
ncbi:MAG: hypothetical protein KGM45_03705 [Actinomycetales bacterium]|nr:hypothetical protein [Actinomycetales bacterium]